MANPKRRTTKEKEETIKEDQTKVRKKAKETKGKKPLRDKIKYELAEIKNRQAQIKRHIRDKVFRKYGFNVNLSLSNHKNVIKIYSDMPWWYCRMKPSNSALHDLTEDNLIPSGAQSVLGLGKSFIPIPDMTTHRGIAKKALGGLLRSANWKCFFAGLDNTLPDSKLFVPSKKSPPLPPYEVDRRMQDFFCQVSKMFHSKKSKSNLLPFQSRMFADI